MPHRAVISAARWKPRLQALFAFTVLLPAANLLWQAGQRFGGDIPVDCQLVYDALGKKAGIQRYGFALPMDEADAKVLLDFGGRPWIVWDVDFQREKIGDVPTEMFYHFFKSFSDHAKCNINISANGTNEHHIIESIFKAFAKAILMAKTRNVLAMDIPSTKGSL